MSQDLLAHLPSISDTTCGLLPAPNNLRKTHNPPPETKCFTTRTSLRPWNNVSKEKKKKTPHVNLLFLTSNRQAAPFHSCIYLKRRSARRQQKRKEKKGNASAIFIKNSKTLNTTHFLAPTFPNARNFSQKEKGLPGPPIHHSHTYNQSPTLPRIQRLPSFRSQSPSHILHPIHTHINTSTHTSTPTQPKQCAQPTTSAAHTAPTRSSYGTRAANTPVCTAWSRRGVRSG